jgi:hypothetical protein
MAVFDEKQIIYGLLFEVDATGLVICDRVGGRDFIMS